MSVDNAKKSITILGVLNIKDCKTLNFIPALFVPVIWCLLAGSML